MILSSTLCFLLFFLIIITSLIFSCFVKKTLRRRTNHSVTVSRRRRKIIISRSIVIYFERQSLSDRAKLEDRKKMKRRRKKNVKPVPCFSHFCLVSLLERGINFILLSSFSFLLCLLPFSFYTTLFFLFLSVFGPLLF